MRRHLSLLPLLVTLCLLSTTACKDSKGNEAGAEGGTAGTDTDDGSIPIGAPATNLAIAKVSISQGVEVTLYLNGNDITDLNTQLVRGRHALVRVFVAPLTGWQPHEVQGVLTLEGEQGTRQYESIIEVSALSTDADLGSTFSFEIPAEDLPSDQAMSVSLHELGDASFDGDSSQSTWPSAGSYEAPFTPVGPLRITLVPVQYDADGSGRLPDVSEPQLQLYEDLLLGMYPVPSVEITVADPFPWGATVAANGQGWQQLLSAMVNLRGALSLGNDEYIYGLFNADDTFQGFCSFGCVAGLSLLSPNAGDAMARASIGVGFSGPDAVVTLAHEVGHAHGREHAPCMLLGQPSDPNYPYDNAVLGVWGWDGPSGALKEPFGNTDIMGYCKPNWISDYTFDGLLTRSLAVNEAGMADELPLREWSSTWVDEHGAVGTISTQMLGVPESTGSGLHPLRYLDGEGAVVREDQARFYPTDHLPGGMLLWPRAPESARAVDIAGFGQITL
jgi:hypothetical protein